jgi:cell wall-associated NlpC family hydrolase
MTSRALRHRIGLPALAAVVLVVALALGFSGGSHHAPPRAPAHAVAHAPAQAVAVAAEAPDPLAAQSYPDPAGAVSHARAAAPSVAAARADLSPGAPSLAQVKRELQHEQDLRRAQSSAGRTSGYIDPVSGAFSPANVVPLKVSEVIAGANAIADFPYVYGGGHASFIDRAYDCSGSVSYALAAAGLIGAPETSGQLEHWGVAGPGRYITVFADVGHTFMNVDGVWFDTAGRAGPYSTRWLRPNPSLAGYVVRHYPGL